MQKQESLFDRPSESIISQPTAWSEAERGMKQAEDHADEAWKDCMLRCVKQVAVRQGTLTTDDVHAAYEALPAGKPTTHTDSAIGPVMVLARKMKLIKTTGQYIRSKRIPSHGKLIVVWESLLFNAPF